MSAVRCSHTDVRDEDWRRSSVFHTYITYEENNYKLIDEDSCVNINAKIALEKMGLKVKSHLHPIHWVDKTDQSITQRCQVLIHMSSYEDHVWCDVLNID